VNPSPMRLKPATGRSDVDEQVAAARRQRCDHSLRIDWAVVKGRLDPQINVAIKHGRLPLTRRPTPTNSVGATLASENAAATNSRATQRPPVAEFTKRLSRQIVKRHWP
jgi:hypothetical protein